MSAESKEVTVTTPPLPPDKPGWKTTEFWATIATFVVAGLIQIGIIPTDGEGVWPKIVALGLQAAAGAGYAISRGTAKGKGGSSGGFTIKLLLLGCATAGVLAMCGCNGGSFTTEGTMALTINPDPEPTAGSPTISVPLQLVPMGLSPAAPPGSAVTDCPPCPPCPECPTTSAGEVCAPSGQWGTDVAGR